jgi:hypothetical protein
MDGFYDTHSMAGKYSTNKELLHVEMLVSRMLSCHRKSVKKNHTRLFSLFSADIVDCHRCVQCEVSGSVQHVALIFYHH